MSRNPLKVLQLSDLHLLDDPQSEVKGVRTQESLDAVVSHARERHADADIVLVTGDLTHEAGESAYRRLHEILARFECPVYCLPGNHDRLQAMRRHLNSERVRTPSAARHGRWLFVFLDSRVEGAAHGHLDGRQFDRLGRKLEASNAPHVLVCVHHPPVAVGSAWLDATRLDNGESLLSLVHMERRIRALAFGHVHQPVLRLFDGLPLLGAPSTCFQFRPRAETFALDGRPPGYRWLRLFEDGTLATGVEWVDRR